MEVYMKKNLLWLLSLGMLLFFVSCGNVSSSGSGNQRYPGYDIDQNYSVVVTRDSGFGFAGETSGTEIPEAETSGTSEASENVWLFSYEEVEYEDDDGIESLKLEGEYTIKGKAIGSQITFKGTSLNLDYTAFSREEYFDYKEDIVELEQKVSGIQPVYNLDEKTIKLEVTDPDLINRDLSEIDDDYEFYKMKYSDLLDELFDAIGDGDIVKTTPDRSSLIIIDYDDDEKEKIVFTKK